MKLDLDFSEALSGIRKDKDAEDAVQDHKPLTPRPKTEARLMAVQAVYQNLLLGEDVVAILKTFNPAYLKERKAHAGLFALLFEGVMAEKNRYQALLGPLLSDAWKWERLGYVEQAILLCGVAELDICQETPFKVILNEFLTIAHSYFEAKDVGFINGVLDKAVPLLRSDVS